MYVTVPRDPRENWEINLGIDFVRLFGTMIPCLLALGLLKR